MKKLLLALLLIFFVFHVTAIDVNANKKEAAKEWKKNFDKESKSLIKKKQYQNQKSLKYNFPLLFKKRAKLFSVFSMPIYFSTNKNEEKHFTEMKAESSEDTKRRLRD